MPPAVRTFPGPYYPAIFLAAEFGTVYIAPTFDLITILLASLQTIPLSLLLGFIVRRGFRLRIPHPHHQYLAGMAVGAAGTLICFLVHRLLPYLT